MAKKKMYYSEQEAAEKLGVSPEELEKLVGDKKLRAFQDGAKKMYRVDEVDALAPETGGEEEIELAPADTAEAISLTEADQPPEPSKEDTVITAEGISIFDDEDLEIEAADPLAKTQISPPLQEQLSSDSVGSGSGLLDLTRESDDTSLGAEILDHIDMEGAIGSSLAAEALTEPEPFEPTPEGPAPVPTVVEEIDPTAGLFNGIIVGSCVVMLILGAVMLAAMAGVVPGYLKLMWENLVVFLLVSVAIVAVSALGGYFVGKSGAARQMALRGAGEET